MFTKLKFLVLIFLVVAFESTLSATAEDTSTSQKTNPSLSWTIGLPFKLVGLGVCIPTGLLVGSVAGFIRGGVKGTEFMAEKLGDKGGIWQRSIGALIAAIPGGVSYSLAGGAVSLGKGAWIGLQKPLEYPTVQSALEGIPLAAEKTAEKASRVFSSKENI